MQALAITTDRGSFTASRIQSSYLRKHSKPTRVCFSKFVSLPKSRLLSRSSCSQKQIVPVLVTASSSDDDEDDDDDDYDYDDDDDDVLAKMNPVVRKRVEVLIEIENQYKELNEKFIEERSALEAKYLELYQPLFNKRYEIINDEKEGVPNFWLTVLKNNKITGKDITERDEEALKYLKDIKWGFHKRGVGFKLEFFFDEKNPYMKNTVLTKEYYIGDAYFNYFLWVTEGTRNIEWYPGKHLILPRKLPKNLTKAEKDFVSFFNFFSPDQYGHWSLANMKDTRVDFKTGRAIKHEIISHAVSWFTGENLALNPNVEVLREIQKQYDELEANYLEERAALEAKYHKLYQALYTKRYEIVNGEVEVEGAPEQGEDKSDKVKGVPDFWLNALKSNAYTTYEINDRDEEALKYLKDIKWSWIEEEGTNWWSKPEEPRWCKIEFFFDEKNPYFKNSVLTNTYHIINGDVHRGIKKVIGTEIEWYPGNCLTDDFVSFFDFFSPPSDYEFRLALEYKYEIIPLAASLFLEDVPRKYNSDADKDDYDPIYDDGDDYWEEIFSKSPDFGIAKTGQVYYRGSKRK